MSRIYGTPQHVLQYVAFTEAFSENTVQTAPLVNSTLGPPVTTVTTSSSKDSFGKSVLDQTPVTPVTSSSEDHQTPSVFIAFERKMKSLTPLNTNFGETKCACCGVEKRSEFQADFLDGSWLFVCADCGVALMKLRGNPAE